MYEHLTLVERMECRRVAQRMAPVYRAIGWLWGSGVDASPPSEYQIEATLCDLANGVLAEAEKGRPNLTHNTGGLSVRHVGADPTCDEGDPSNPDNHLRFDVRFNP